MPADLRDADAREFPQVLQSFLSTMPTKIAINGFGRIGRLALRRILDKYPQLEVVAINDLANKQALLKVFKNDPVYGSYHKEVKASFFAEKNPAKLPWRKLGVDIVLECTGFFTDKKGASQHLEAGAKKVIISASSKSVSVPTIVLGANEKAYRRSDKIISMASCTTNAVCPVVKVLDNAFGIKNGFINTIHSYTVSQNKIYKNWQNRKASELSIIPAETGAVKTVEKCLPQLKGKLNGLALRVPTAAVSIVDFTVELKKPAPAQKINDILEKASQTKEMRGILKVSNKQSMSRDYLGSSYSSIVASDLTESFSHLAKVMIWYDNEFGYACRLADFTAFVADGKTSRP